MTVMRSGMWSFGLAAVCNGILQQEVTAYGNLECDIKGLENIVEREG